MSAGVSTLILVLCLALLACVVVGALAVAAVLLVHVWRWARRTDSFEPAAAEAPPTDAALADVQRVFAGGLDDDGDHIAAPYEAQFYELIRRYRAGEDIETGAPRERP